MSQHLKKYLPKLRYALYVLLFFWLLTGCSSQIGVTTETHFTKYKTITTTGLSASITLEDVTLSNTPTPTN